MPEVVMNSLLIRPLHPEDLPEVIRIENASFPSAEAWSQRKFEQVGRRRDVRSFVAADRARRLVGYLVYESATGYFRILNLAVDPEFRRQGVAWQLVRQLLSQAGQVAGGFSVKVVVEEENLTAQQFFRASGFRGRLSHDADRDWVEFEWFSAGAAGFRDAGSAVLNSILHGDGRTLRI